MTQSTGSSEATYPPSTAYPPLSSYGLIGDCHSAALVSTDGSIDWCCLPRFDSDSCFGRLLDWQRGGYWRIAPCDAYRAERHYLPNSLILVTRFVTARGEVRLIDCVAMRRGGRTRPRRRLLRILEGVRGSVDIQVHAQPRFDFGEVKPWIYELEAGTYAAVGSNKGLIFSGDASLRVQDVHDLAARFTVRSGERRHMVLQFAPPEELSDLRASGLRSEDPEDHFQETVRWWQDWTSRIRVEETAGAATLMRSAIVLKALNYAPTGAIVAAPTTSLPEFVGGERNWDYRYSWLRDSIFTVHALADLGCEGEADGFRRFIQRSAAGNADELQVMYGIDGKRRLTEVVIPALAGWRDSRPVRIGNGAYDQLQADMYGHMLELAWRWSERGKGPDAAHWKFLVDLVEVASQRWVEPDRGIWEIRSAPRHFVYSKVMCWVAVHRGIELAQRHDLPAPLAHWAEVRLRMREAIESQGIDRRRGIFVESFGSTGVDSALLLLPAVGFIDYRDPLMMRTAATIRRELDHGGMILRYRTEDGLPDPEGVFLACSFWLAECLALQGELTSAEQVFAQAAACANDLGLFAEEFAPASGEPLGNFPQGLSHLAHISAALALQRARAVSPPASERTPPPA